ncbi:MAG: hypothetical protein AAEJ47_11125 [Planctomycetota bacterium]
MRDSAIDRILWLALLAIPLVAWLLFDSPPAPTEFEEMPTTPSHVDVEPQNPTTDPGSGVTNLPQPDPGSENTNTKPTPVATTLTLNIRALSSRGNLLPEGTPLPLLNGQGQVLAGAGGRLEMSGAGVRVLTSEGTEHPLELSAGTWVLDCTFQDSAKSAPLEVPWVVHARPEDPQSPAHLILTGQTLLPPGSRLVVQLLDGESVLDGGILTTEGSQIWWDRTLVPRKWFATLLTLRVQWRSSAATEVVLEKVAQIWEPALRGENWTWDGSCGIDDRLEAQRQSGEITAWFTQALNEVETSRDLLLMAGAKARGKRASLLKDDERVDRMLDHPLAGSIDRLGRGASFDFKRWRRLIDEQFPLRWQAWADPASVPWPDRHPGAAKNIGLLFQTLNKYSRLESTIVYEQLGKPRHIDDFVADFDWEPTTERTQTLKKIRNFVASIRETIIE